ncbi:inactive peptidyl-prolyl cis-trans isomerase shutdown [Drosophila subpulchrella]|uniref:inactive peptidyl-prolyl cis-trans isomerase shutdown n=1 Tax=Drosophila subpulchrella TaxID=1486046 RepID=UPI0018A14CF4|nr:inactive peptidyl-prolyl cis-trans isomerase shutdown [Drosophila subpulchrella]
MWDMTEQRYYGDMSEVSYEAVPSPWTESLEKLRTEMNRIDEHIYKHITREGHEERDPVPPKARVSIRYRAYWEGESTAFKSSKLLEFETGGDMVLQGLETAVRTMRPYEKADFVISFEQLCGELGSPPLIKPKADGLFQVEVIDYSLIEENQIPEEERDKFYVVYPKAKDFYLEGKIWLRRYRYRNAETSFQKAIDFLKTCRMTDSEEKRQQNDLLINLFQGLMVCYNSLNRPKCACTTMKELRLLTGNQPSWRALYQEGRALTILGDYDRARISYKRAQKKQPDNQDIEDEITKITKRINNLEVAKRELWERATKI